MLSVKAMIANRVGEVRVVIVSLCTASFSDIQQPWHNIASAIRSHCACDCNGCHVRNMPVAAG
jgi:hypothetical protein